MDEVKKEIKKMIIEIMIESMESLGDSIYASDLANIVSKKVEQL
jgi:hypothetical protein